MSKRSQKQSDSQEDKKPELQAEPNEVKIGPITVKGKQEFVIGVLIAILLLTVGFIAGAAVAILRQALTPDPPQPTVAPMPTCMPHPTDAPCPTCAPCPTYTLYPTYTPLPPISTPTIIPTSPPPEAHTVKVSASAYPFVSTNILIKKGDVVQIIVQGYDANWDCGKSASSAEGWSNDKWIGHLVPSANQCELVGFIQDGVFLRIGAYEQFEADESGSLHLGANDDPNQFDDNSGTLDVRIVVTRQ